MLCSVAEEKVVMMAAMGKIVNDGRDGSNYLINETELFHFYKSG